MQRGRWKWSRIVKIAEMLPFIGQIFNCQFWEQITALFHLFCIRVMQTLVSMRLKAPVSVFWCEHYPVSV